MFSDFVNIFGAYQPIVTTLADGTQSVSPDWAHICYYILVVLFVYGFIRILKGVLCRERR